MNEENKNEYTVEELLKVIKNMKDDEEVIIDKNGYHIEKREQ